MDVVIRNMTAEDAAMVQQLSQQLGYSLTIQETERQISMVLQREDHVAFVGVIGKEVVGWVHAFISITIESKPFVEIGGLVIDEVQRGKGIGAKLVEKIKGWSKEKDINSLRVRSNVKRNGAHAFYSKISFKEIKEQKVFAVEL